ncbi:helix-turn-helix domain-containing protein [Sorangium sp. So ce124]|uniref:helix-turn-helix domain-containing protein n=1 Tax=Sorangium sp. So ce124 TaxID=3133280 RepID=UPI003F61108E
MTESAHRPEIERALRFIAANLERPITVADVARAARLSEFHFHRVFHAAVGEPIGRFITRRRLEQSALRLAYEPDRSIMDVALSSGYSSASNFSNAFAAHFGCSPSQVRTPERGLPVAIGRLTSLYGKDFRPEELYTTLATTDPLAPAVNLEAIGYPCYPSHQHGIKSRARLPTSVRFCYKPSCLGGT